MADTRDVVVIVGSLRKDSLNRKAANAIAAIAPTSLRFETVAIGQLPFYNQDLDEAPPDAWTAFRDRVRAADAVLFVTPEYNRSVPGVLKNAIDVGSRPHGESAWSGTPAAIVTVSPGAIGGFGANHHLRQSLAYLDMPTLAQPEAYIGNAGALFDDNGAITNDDRRRLLQKFVAAFASWIEKH